MFLIASCPCFAWATGTFDQIKRTHKPSDTEILASNGEVIQRVRTDSSARRGQWVALADVSPALRTALLLSEDKRFYEHSGVDWRAVSSAAWGNVWATRTRGASTISMQLAGLLDDDLRAGAGGRTVVQKVKQTVSTQLLESRWRKDEILEAYLNLVPFRGELVGIDALSRTLFGKAAHGLDEREAAVAAALVRAPNAKPAQVAQRACGVLKLMQAPSKPDCDALDMFATGALQRKAFSAGEGIAPHFAQRLLTAAQPAAATATPQTKPAANAPGSAAHQGNPGTIESTVRAPLQRFAVQTLQQQLRELRGRQVEDGAIVVLDNASGAVLAWVGSSGGLSAAAEVDGVLAPRQPGSTLKPFLYAQAIAERRITAASLLDDSPASIQTASGLYIPQNYDRQFKGWVSARTALGASLNVPAVRTLVMVSPDAFASQLQSVGLPLKESGGYYGYSLALGSSEVSLLALANSYRTLANGGRYSPVVLSPPKGRPEPVEALSTKASTGSARTGYTPSLDPRAAFIVTDILADPLARAPTFGTDSVLATRFWTAVKTGTSKDMRDNWAIGFSQHYTVGVWVGNASGAPMWDVSGTTGAAPIWAAVISFLHRSQPSRAPAAPAGLVQVRTAFGNQLEAARQEWFVQGTEQTLVAAALPSAPVLIARGAGGASAAGQYGVKTGAKMPASDAASAPSPRITSPTSGTVVALDPDIPPQRQRVTFRAEGSNLRWTLDGKVFASGNTAQWLPWPGGHVAQIIGARGEVLDEVRLEVRGAGVK